MNINNEKNDTNIKTKKIEEKNKSIFLGLNQSAIEIIDKIIFRKNVLNPSVNYSELMPPSSNYIATLKAKARFWKYVAAFVIIFSCATALLREYSFRNRIYKTGISFVYEGDGGYRFARVGTVDDDSVIAFSQDIVNWTAQFQYNDVSNFQKALTYFSPLLRSIAEVQFNKRLKLWNTTRTTQFFSIKDIKIISRKETAINEAYFDVKVIGTTTKYWDGQIKDSNIPDEINLKIKFGNLDPNKKWHFTILDYERTYKDQF